MPGAEPRGVERSEARLAYGMVAPAVATILLVALFPLGWTIWESFHLHDLRMPWLGQPFVGLENYGEVLRDRRFWGAMGHTLWFAAASVSLELVLGCVLALAMNRTFRGRALVRASILIPWAIPTVVGALVWRFMFEGLENWLTHDKLAWVPVILADTWKETPFVALLLLAGLQGIDPTLYEAARIDGASAWRQFRFVTLPLLMPAILVALIFRTMNAFRVFDLIYVLTGGGPGTATEPIALYTFNSLMHNLRFGYGSTLSVLVFLVTFALALGYIRLLGSGLTETRS
ncbi:MAG TPA: sugar ABC transporter permease [Gemmatimonadales bacterium]|nr:sugar ABC transporter permease [Gemmatimonadales bacterium]